MLATAPASRILRAAAVAAVPPHVMITPIRLLARHPIASGLRTLLIPITSSGIAKTRLVLAVAEMHGARERRSELEREEAATQVDRLEELLLANTSLQHKMSVLTRELEWSKKAQEIADAYPKQC